MLSLKTIFTCPIPASYIILKGKTNSVFNMEVNLSLILFVFIFLRFTFLKILLGKANKLVS